MKAILFLGGSFNPPHIMHIEIFSIAKHLLETQYDFNITSCFMAIANNGHVRSKLGNDAMPACDRLEMCTLAAENNKELKIDSLIFF